MRLYTLIPNVSGHIDDWIKAVPHIAEMGFDTIHLLPITKMGSSLSPYSSIDPYTIDPMYDTSGTSSGAMQSFEKFIDTLIENKMSLCVDIVLNHISVEHPIFQTNTSWAYHDPNEKDNIKRAGWSDGETWYKWNDLALLNYEGNIDRSLWGYMYNYVLFWAEFAERTKGYIRLDNLHSSHPDFTEYVMSQVHMQCPNVKLLSELFTYENVISKLAEKYRFKFLLATQWEHKFAWQMREYISYIHSDNLSVRYLLPVLSHDSGSIIEEYGSLASTKPRLAISSLLGSGDWGIPQGIEFGIEKKLEFVGQKVTKSWFEEKKHDQAPYKNFIKQLNTVIDSYTFLQDKGNIKLFLNEQEAVISAVRHVRGESPLKTYMLVFINLDTSNPYQLCIEEDVLTQQGVELSSSYKDVLTNETYNVRYSGEKNQRYIDMHIDAAGVVALWREDEFI